MKKLFLLLTLIFGNIFTAISQSPLVESVFPNAQIINAIVNTDIAVRFNTTINPESINDTGFKVFGRWSGPMMGSITLTNSDSTINFTPDEPFFYGEWITVSLSKNIESQGGLNLEYGYSWGFWTETMTGTLNQPEVDVIPVRLDGEGTIQCYGAYAGDINSDGYSDLSVVNEITNDIRLFLNDGQGGYESFEIFDLPNGNTPSPNEGADFNADGVIDLAIANTQNTQVSILMGDGTEGYEPEVSYTADLRVRGIGILDADGDGDDDIVTANRSGNNMSLLLNDGTGVFDPPINFETGGDNETSLAVADVNGDGIMDAFVGGYTSQDIAIMLGDGNGGFTFSDRVDVSGNPWMITTGDVNGDGFADVVSANSTGNTASVIFGDGDGFMDSEVFYSCPGFPLAIDLGDIDGDGDLDMITSNYSTARYNLYENDGEGNFSDPIVYHASTAGSCVILHDRDNDGDMDITGIDEVDDLIFLFENDSTLTSVVELNQNAGIILSQSFPNPAHDQITINYNLNNNSAVLHIYNQLGKIVAKYELNPNGNSVIINVSDYKPGVYIYGLSFKKTRSKLRRTFVIE
jgi:hypothetical protein